MTIEAGGVDHHQSTTTSSSSAGNIRGGGGGSSRSMVLDYYESNKPRIFLAVACLWPFLLLALFASSSPRIMDNNNNKMAMDQHNDAAAAANDGLRLNLRNVLDRVDIMGYGPTHPRIAVVVTGETVSSSWSSSSSTKKASTSTKDDPSPWISTVESIFSHTDLQRIFVVAVVVDGHARDVTWETALNKIHSGQIPHLHGLRLDYHLSPKEKDLQQQHDSKVHVMFNEQPRGITSSRMDGVEFVHILVEHHERAGLKSLQEDIILVFLHAGTVLTSKKWLSAVTDALIVPPPLLPPQQQQQQQQPAQQHDISWKLANAVSFQIEGPGKRTSFDTLLTPRIETPTAEELNLSNGASYMAPAWNGAGLAMRLDTWRQLPVHDEALTDPWPANLDLTLALWLCGDGIDMISTMDDALVLKWSDPKLNPMLPAMTQPSSPAMGARFAEAWMDEILQRKFFHSFTHTYTELTYLEWQTYQAQARQSPTFVADLAQKCRSLEWYMQTVNPQLQSIWEQSATIDHPKQQTPVQQEEQQEESFEKQEEEDQEQEQGDQQEEQEEGDQHEKQEDEEPQQMERHAANEEQPGKKEEQHAEFEKKAEEQAAEQSKDDNTVEEKADVKGNEGERKDAQEEEEDSVVIPPRRELKRPSKPLCDECLKIVEQAKPVNIEYVDASDGHKEHPHMGAKDVDGNWGFVHNETHLRMDPPKFNMTEEDLIAGCKRRDNNYRMLTEKVYVDFEGDKAANEALAKDKRAKLFCLVYTTEKGHEGIPRIRETWGQKCDGFMVASTKTDPSIDAVEIPHEGPEEYNNIWQKVRSMWSYVYDNYYEKYDWFHIGGDDYYLLVENLRLYLESEEIQTASNGGTYLPDGTETSQTPLFLGRRFAYMGNMDDIFNSGGSGYTFNKAALKTLVVDGFPTWRPHAKTFSEDTMVARLLHDYGILPYDTKDELGGERYMPFMPGHHYGYRMPPEKRSDWYAMYSINIKEGADHCAAKSVAFHYVKGLAMYRLHAILYNLCPPGTLS